VASDGFDALIDHRAFLKLPNEACTLEMANMK